MSTESSTHIDDLYGHYSDTDGLELVGSPHSIRQLADCLVIDQSRLQFIIPGTVQASLYDGFITVIQIEASSDSLILRRKGTALTIRGSTEKLAILADYLRGLANKVVETGYAEHLHIEYYPDHFYLDEKSEPLVVSVKA